MNKVKKCKVELNEGVGKEREEMLEDEWNKLRF